MDVSCHSFIRMARLAAPLMKDGGTMFAMSYYGANRVVPNYNVMGPVKAALEAACRYLAFELGPSGIRVHAISPGPLKTRAASGLKDFELLLNEAAHSTRGISYRYFEHVCDVCERRCLNRGAVRRRNAGIVGIVRIGYRYFEHVCDVCEHKGSDWASKERDKCLP